MPEQLAIIRNPAYGVYDRPEPMLRFDTYLSESSGAFQVFYQPEADAIIKDHKVREIGDLEGKPCWVEKDGGRITYLRAAKL